jgi:hypothetical protein
MQFAREMNRFTIHIVLFSDVIVLNENAARLSVGCNMHSILKREIHMYYFYCIIA